MSTKTASDESKSLQLSSQGHAVSVSGGHATAEQKIIHRSLIGKAVTIRGDLSAREDILINGKLQGSIALKSNHLEIGPDGCIEANTFAKVVVVSGKLIGDVYASDQVVVTKTGSVVGNIYTADVSIEDGAHIKGDVDMQRQDIFRNHAASEIDDESHNKASGFGFLFKKGREHEHGEHAADHAEHAHINISEELIPLSANSESSSGVLYPEQSIIGETIMIKGELIAGEDVIVQGQIDGVIYFLNNSIGIGPHSQVHGNIFVKSIISHGAVKGDVYASDQIILKKPGHVNGKLHSPRVSTEKGAVIMGSIVMEPQNIEEVYANFSSAHAVDHQHPVSSEHKSHAEDVQIVSRAAETVHDDGQKASVSSKESGWPIFYPRT